MVRSKLNVFVDRPDRPVEFAYVRVTVGQLIIGGFIEGIYFNGFGVVPDSRILLVQTIIVHVTEIVISFLIIGISFDNLFSLLNGCLQITAEVGMKSFNGEPFPVTGILGERQCFGCIFPAVGSQAGKTVICHRKG